MKKLSKIHSNRLDDLKKIRENLFNLIKNNKNFNLRILSRELGKNDAYLQQYIKRGSPNFLPEEERLKLSEMLNLNYDELTPNWILKQNDKETLKVCVENNAITSNFLNLPIEFFCDIKISDKKNLKFSKFVFKDNISNFENFIYTISDFGIKKFQDNNNYILNNKKNFFIVNLSLDKRDIQNNINKLIVKPLEKKYSSFRIDESKLNIYGKILYISNYVYRN